MFTSIERTPLPEQSRLEDNHKQPGTKIPHIHADCFSLAVRKTVLIEGFVEAFYTSWIFKIERKILALVVGKPSTDTQAIELSVGQRNQFSAWNLEYRDENQLVLADFMGKTKSWLMVQNTDETSTTLFFGSAVMPRLKKDGSLERQSLVFSVLGAFHLIYSRALLWAASRNLPLQSQKAFCQTQKSE